MAVAPLAVGTVALENALENNMLLLRYNLVSYRCPKMTSFVFGHLYRRADGSLV